ncbi:CDP-alcohol phosphatidyltransferase family protein [Ruminococcus sp.]|uniref:CDP-alcohol phosphatidyltransferase family protein n=1 Tax=Ruminococcus sp. TaxID=41978 RepID=UPI002E807D24|nr:CDP-alcohol phosphatidyltransferase family protein [Ruminococcus sp.]MEE3438725.1 CDP-alcohol phosphatidyltransferase family protein [Ruminococcus sp.]
MNSEEKKEINNDSSDEILTIPNILSFFRILLITPFMILFLNGQYVWAAVMIIISGLTDCVDGFVARHFNQVSNFGKILDPVADKLTLLAVGIGICILTPEVITVMVILIIKDLLMLIGGIALIKNDIQPPQARWYGKVGTILFYISVCTIVVLKVFGIEVPYLSVILLSITVATMIFALVKYFLLFLDLITNGSNQKKGE